MARCAPAAAPAAAGHATGDRSELEGGVPAVAVGKKRPRPPARQDQQEFDSEHTADTAQVQTREAAPGAPESGCGARLRGGERAAAVGHLLQSHSKLAPRAAKAAAREDAPLRTRARLAARRAVGISVARRSVPLAAGVGIDCARVGGGGSRNDSSSLQSSGHHSTRAGSAVTLALAPAAVASGDAPGSPLLGQAPCAQRVPPAAGEVNSYRATSSTATDPPAAIGPSGAGASPTGTAGVAVLAASAAVTANPAPAGGRDAAAGAPAHAGVDAAAPWSAPRLSSSRAKAGATGSTQISNIARALARTQELAASQTADPDRRLGAVIQSKLLTSSRILHLMRGQALAALRTGVALPMCSVTPGGPRGPMHAVHMVAIENTTARDSEEARMWAAVRRDCVAAAAALQKARAREVRAAAAAAGAGGSSAAAAAGAATASGVGVRLAASLCTGVTGWHAAALAEVKRRREEAARKRIEALKSSDMQSYLAMVRAEKSSRLSGMLRQTDECLRSFARRLGLERVVGGDDAGPAGSASASKTGGPDGKVQADASGEALLESSEGWSRLAARLAADIPEQPSGLKAQLREYQMHGLRWLVGLHDAGLNGILADDMGLGKTVQVIALITYLVEVRGQPGPFLIAAPSSVLPNWASELARWAPGLKVVDYRGSAEAREQIWFDQICGYGGGGRSRPGGGRAPFHVLLTSYEFLMGRNDRPRLCRLCYSHIIVDEGHRLKNAGCKLNTELGHYRTASRLLLTGTPLQNRLDELWSLLNFLMPGLFDSSDDFAAWFSAPLEALRGAGGCGSSEGDVAALSQEEYLLVTSRLHQVLRPFMLRRLKESVASELPAKSEVVLTAAMGPYQAALMNIVKNGFERAAAAGGPGGGGGGSSSTAVNRAVNNTVMEMRNICNHPYISKLHPEHGYCALPPAAHRHCGLPPCVTLCGKMDLLDRLLVRLHATRHKVLLFATMTRALDMVEEYLEWRGFEAVRLDGSTAAAERGAMIVDFNKPDSTTFIFLLSLKAGGVGLNLQAADTVILFDTDWNPQLDLQAQARAHRIGQTREVRVFRLLTANSIEQHIATVAEEKRKFADSSITGGFFDGKTSAEERREYLIRLLASTNMGAGAGGSGGSGSGSAEAGFLSDAELNRLVARGEQELGLLEAEDERRRRLAQTAGLTAVAAAGSAAAAGGGSEASTGRYSRLLPAELCEPLISLAVEVNRPKDKDEGKVFGRGMRRVNAESSASAASGARPLTGAGGSITAVNGAGGSGAIAASGRPPKGPSTSAAGASERATSPPGDIEGDGDGGSSVPARARRGRSHKVAPAATASAARAGSADGCAAAPDAAPVAEPPLDRSSRCRRSQRRGEVDASAGGGAKTRHDDSGGGGQEGAAMAGAPAGEPSLGAQPGLTESAVAAPAEPVAAAPLTAPAAAPAAALKTGPVAGAATAPAVGTAAAPAAGTSAVAAPEDGVTVRGVSCLEPAAVAAEAEPKSPIHPQPSSVQAAPAAQTRPDVAASAPCAGATAIASATVMATAGAGVEALPVGALGPRAQAVEVLPAVNHSTLESHGGCTAGAAAEGVAVTAEAVTTAAVAAAAASGAAVAFAAETTKATTEPGTALRTAVSEGQPRVSTALEELPPSAAAAAANAAAKGAHVTAASAASAWADGSDPWVGTQLTVAMNRGRQERGGTIMEYDASRIKCQWYLRYDGVTTEGTGGEWGLLDEDRAFWLTYRHKRRVLALSAGPAADAAAANPAATATAAGGGSSPVAWDPEPASPKAAEAGPVVKKMGLNMASSGPNAAAAKQGLFEAVERRGAEAGPSGRTQRTDQGPVGARAAEGLTPPLPDFALPVAEADGAPAADGSAVGAAAECECVADAAEAAGASRQKGTPEARATDQGPALGQDADGPTSQGCAAGSQEAATVGARSAGGVGADGDYGGGDEVFPVCRQPKRGRKTTGDRRGAAAGEPKRGEDARTEEDGEETELAGDRAAAKRARVWAVAAPAAAGANDAGTVEEDGTAFIGLKAKVSWGREGTFCGVITRFDTRRARLKWLMSYADGDEEWGAVTEDRNGWRVHGGLRPLTWVGRKPRPAPPPPPPPLPAPPALAQARVRTSPLAGPLPGLLVFPVSQPVVAAPRPGASLEGLASGPLAAGSEEGLLGAQIKLAGRRDGQPLSGTITEHDPDRPRYKSYLLYDSSTAAYYKARGEWGVLEADHSAWLSHGYKRRVLSVASAGLSAEGLSLERAPGAGVSGPTGGAVQGAAASPGARRTAEASPPGVQQKYGPTEVGPTDHEKQAEETEAAAAAAEDEGGRRAKRARVGAAPAETPAGQSLGARSGVERAATGQPPEHSWRSGGTGGDADDAAGGSGDDGAREVDAATSVKQAGGDAGRSHGVAGRETTEDAAERAGAGIAAPCGGGGGALPAAAAGPGSGGTAYRFICQRNGRYRGDITLPGRRLRSPYYDTPEAAAAAADYYNYKLRGTAAHLNLGLTAEQRVVLDQLTLEQLQAYIKGRGDIHDLSKALLQFAGPAGELQ